MRQMLFALSVLFILVFLCACAAIVPPAQLIEVTPEIVVEPVATIAPAPEPTSEPTPRPTPTPDPYTEGMERTELAPGFFYVELNDALKARITGLSYPSDDSDASISYDELRYVRILYCDFEGSEHVGELIVNKALALEVTQIFYELYTNAYPLTSVNLVDDYGEVADDNVSMAANNTSAFNYRVVAGTKKLSRHSLGAAIDINPRLNPYVVDGRISPENGAEYSDRSVDFPGKIDHEDLCYKLFTSYGWEWGGDWNNSKDYQHFSKDLG